ncbi:hypothetical protein [Pedobacter steynii]|nr:hypothetical protein [Pedobacter steynii]
MISLGAQMVVRRPSIGPVDQSGINQPPIEGELRVNGTEAQLQFI